MSFAYPSFLWALTALSIPIIIHLFNFRRTTRVYFSNTRLLKQIKQETTQKRKLKQYLVLASRLLFLLFLVLAFAQPFLPASQQTTAGKNVVIYIDNSYSMSAPVEGNQRALDEAIELGNEILNTFPPETRYKLLTNDFAPFSNSYKTKLEIADLLSQLRHAVVGRSLQEVGSRLETNAAGAEVFFISDFQRSTLGDLSKTKLDSVNQWHLIALNTNEVANVFIDSVYLDNPLTIGGERNSVHVKLRNAGQRPLEGLVVKLSVNDVQFATGAVDIVANGFAETNFDLATQLKGLNKAKVSVSDFPISFDNELLFTLNAASKISVVEIRAEGAPLYIEKVFGNTDLFTFRSMPTSNVDFGAAQQADVLVLHGLRRLEPTIVGMAKNLLNSAGVVLVIPSPDSDLQSYRSLIPYPNLTIAPSPDLEPLQRPDFENPFFQNVFEEQSESMAMPEARRYLQWSEDRTAILKFRDGKPYLTESQNLFVLATPLTVDYTTLSNHALFVPVMYRVAASLRKDQQQLYYLLSDKFVRINADSLVGEEPVRLVGNEEIIPPQRKSSDHVLMEIPRFSVSAGYYHAVVKADTLGLLAFDLDKRESLMDTYDPQQVQQEVEGRITVFDADNASDFAGEIKSRYVGTPLWKYALLLSLLFLLAEVLLIRLLK